MTPTLNHLEALLFARNVRDLPRRDVTRSEFMRLAIRAGRLISDAGKDADTVAGTGQQVLIGGEWIGIATA